MSKTVKEHCFARISVISQPFWLFLGSFRRVDPCGLRVRVDAGAGVGQAELPMGYPRQSLIMVKPLKGIVQGCKVVRIMYVTSSYVTTFQEGIHCLHHLVWYMTINCR